MIARALSGVARYGRTCLVAGLLAGLFLPGLAAALRPWLPELVAVLLFLTALRIGPRAALGGLADLPGTLALVLAFQLALPLAALGLFAGLGVAGTPLGLALVLMLAAPSVSGSPNFTLLTGHDPAPAMRLLILGTAIFPATVLPVLWLAPGLGAATEVIAAAARLFGVIGAAVAAGFGLRRLIWRRVPEAHRRAFDGLAALLLSVMVVGLMAALGPALRGAPLTVLAWLGAAVGANFGLQVAARLILGPGRRDTAAIGIVAGNRNIALFLVALPAATTDPLLIFIGCYQVPMFLTPILMRRLYRLSPDPA